MHPEAKSVEQRDGAHHGVAGRLRAELRRYWIVVAYLYVCFGALTLYKVGVLSEVGSHYVPLGFAAAKALILGKFVLIGESARIGSRPGGRTLLDLIVRKVLSFLLLLIALSVAEEFVAGWLHGRSFAQTLAEYERRSLLEILATCLLVLLVLIPMIATGELSRALGPGVLRRLLLSPARDTASPQAGDVRGS
jgi:hypothetical protein